MPVPNNVISIAVRCSVILSFFAIACSSPRPTRVEIKEGLGLFESLIPVSPDSVVELYEDFEPARFHKMYGEYLGFAQKIIDSLNVPLKASSRIDTLAIDHAIENFGNAARIKKTIFISSSYFFLFNDRAVIRSILTHEFGHIYLERLSQEQRVELTDVWNQLRSHALLYIFRDGEYSGNAKFGGHPEESPEELFASAFNLIHNKSDEIDARLLYVDPVHYPLIGRLRSLVAASTNPSQRRSFP